MHPKQLWSAWLSLTLELAVGFTQRGQNRFVEWVTGLALNVEEHTITQSLIGIDRPQDWKALESFAEYGSWNMDWLQRRCGETIAALPNSLFHGFHVWAGDDTKVHRSSADVWGTCTFHEYGARCPNRATTVRAHNWVILGGLVPAPDEPPMFMPTAGRLYFRKSQLPAGEAFHTKNELLIDLVRQQTKSIKGLHLAVFDGAFAVANVVRPLVRPAAPHLRVEFVTRLRRDARLFALPPEKRRANQKWGHRLSPPSHGGRWPGEWQEGKAFLYGRQRMVHYKEILCQWHVLGHENPVKAVVAEVEGFSKRFTLVTSAVKLTALEILELFCGRFRQEDGFRDLKQRLGWEECRAWTKNPIERTTQAVIETLTLMRLLQYKLDATAGDTWWLHTPWNDHKTRPSVLDLERLLRRHRTDFQRFLSEWLGSEGKTEGSDRDTVPK